MAELPERIKQLREELRGDDGYIPMSIEEAANTLKPRTTGKTWSKWERGPGNPGGGEPDLANFRSLARFFGVSADYLLGWTDERARSGEDAERAQAAERSAVSDEVAVEGAARAASPRRKRAPRTMKRRPES